MRWVVVVLWCPVSAVCGPARAEDVGPVPSVESRGEGSSDPSLVFTLDYVAERSATLEGGVREASSFRHLLSLVAELDLEAAAGWRGATLSAQFLGVERERGGSADSGDIQTYSNLETDRSLAALYELWFEQRLLDDRLRLKVGKVDASSEFGAVEVAGDFASSSAGVIPTIHTLPTYPEPAMSLNIFYDLIHNEAHGLTLGYGLYDGANAVDGVPTGSRGPSTFFSDSVSDDEFHILEAAWTWSTSSGRPGRLAAGAWRHTGRFETFTGDTTEGTDGVYLLAEQRLTPPRARDGAEAGTTLFAQYGSAEEEVSEIAGHLALGLVRQGLGGRADDSLGLYVTHVDLSDAAGAAFPDDETAFDLYYRAQLAPWVALQPELHYIVDPSGDPTLDDALVASLRLVVSLGS